MKKTILILALMTCVASGVSLQKEEELFGDEPTDNVAPEALTSHNSLMDEMDIDLLKAKAPVAVTPFAAPIAGDMEAKQLLLQELNPRDAKDLFLQDVQAEKDQLPLPREILIP